MRAREKENGGVKKSERKRERKIVRGVTEIW